MHKSAWPLYIVFWYASIIVWIKGELMLSVDMIYQFIA